MSSRDEKLPAKTEVQYGDEVLCANWNPLALLLAEPLSGARAASVDGGDAEAFLARLYRCQQA